jgi:Major capsid protein N-terminus
MAGALMQLVAYGAQDVFLTGNPEITFWKVSYRRHTNFAMESIEQTFSGQADFGRRVTCTISRNGDLCYRTYLQVTLPEINQSMNTFTPVGAGDGVYARWLDFIGEQLIAQVEVEIGGQRIDRQYGDWMHIWNQLTMSTDQKRGYFAMVGNTTQLTYITDPTFAAISGPCAAANGPAQVCAPRNALPETTLYVPLLFWFCRNPGLALPLIALKSVGQKSIHPKASEPCFSENMLWSRDTMMCQTQMLVTACC